MATRGRPKHPDILTPREWEVLALIREDLTNDQIAQRLAIGAEGVKSHVSAILGKLSLSSREEAAAWDPRQRPDWTPRWDPTRRPAWATALAPLGLFWRRLAGGLAHSAGSLATVTSVGLGVAVVAGITTFGVLVVRTSGSSNDAGATPPAVVGQSAATGKIAFLSFRDGNLEIYVMNADGSGQTNLSNGPGEDSFGAWSPDGSRIAFVSDRDGNSEIYVVNADGSGQTNLSNNPGDDEFGAWAPDGSRIAYTSRDHIEDLTNDNFTPGLDLTPGNSEATPNTNGPTVTPNGEVYVVNADGSGLTNLTNKPGDDFFQGWSRDGSRIAFASSIPALNPDDGFTTESYVVNADGSGLTKLTNKAFDDFFGALSPDGSRIAFTSDRNGISVMNADGSGQTNLTTGSSETGSFDSNPTWSPDGSRIWFLSIRDGHYEFYVMNADGSGQTRLTNFGDFGGCCRVGWSPDGSRMAKTSSRDGNTEIYVVNADGSGETNLTNDPALDFGPAWSPDGARIAFTSGRGNFDIYIMNADGSGLTNLTNNPGEDYDPVWSPAP